MWPWFGKTRLGVWGSSIAPCGVRRVKQNRIGMVLALVGIVAILAIKNTTGKAQQRLKSKECGNQMLRVSVATLMWMQQDRNGLFPEDFVQLFDVLGPPKSLKCPSDAKRVPIFDWQQYRPERVTYLVINPGISLTNTNSVFAICPIHGHVIKGDGILYDKEGRKFEQGVW